MAEFGGHQDRGVWLRWQSLAASAAAPPDALVVAAYAEGRLSEDEAAPVEAWLAAYPEALAEILAARALPQQAEMADERMIAAACALVLDTATLPDNVVLFPHRHRPVPWRNALAWSSIVASLAAASFVGFVMGSDAYQGLVPSQSSDNGYAETFEAAPGLDAFVNDDSGT